MNTLAQSFITLAHGADTDLGKMAREHILHTATLRDYNEKYQVLNKEIVSGWDLVLLCQDPKVLQHALSLAQTLEAKDLFPARLQLRLPDANKNCADLIYTLWLTLAGDDWDKQLWDILRGNRLEGPGGLAVIDFLENKEPTFKMLDRLAIWRVETHISTKLAKRVDAMFKSAMQDETTAEKLVQSLIATRGLPHAIAWLAIVGEGRGFAKPFQQRNFEINALFDRALKALASAHGRLTVLSRLSKFKSHTLVKGKDMTAALRLAINE